MAETKPPLGLDPNLGAREFVLEVDAEALEKMRKVAHVQIPLIQEIGRYLAASGGKRIRPVLLLLAARAGDRRDDRDVLYAAVTGKPIEGAPVDQKP